MTKATFLINLKSLLLSLLATIFIATSANAQSLIHLSDATGISISASEEAELQRAADSLIAAFPVAFQDSFKVYDCGLYLQQEHYQGGYPEVFGKLVEEAGARSKYYLVVGKSLKTDGNLEIWLKLNLPSTQEFSCLDKISQNLRKNLNSKFGIIANEFSVKNDNNFLYYYQSFEEVLNQLKAYIIELKLCCDYQSRDGNQCSSCILTILQFENTLNKAGLLGAHVSKVIDNTHLNMGEEEIGYSIESESILINLDSAIANFKSEILAKFPNATIKIYPFSYIVGCSDFEDIYTNFLSTNADIGLILGVTGKNAESGKIWWQLISKDDDHINPPSYSGNNNSIYFFNKGKFKGKTTTIVNTRPKGVFQQNNIATNAFGYYSIAPNDLEFIFADSELTPLTITSEDLQDGILQTYQNTNEPLLNKALIMSKEQIIAQLAEQVSNPYGNPKGVYQKGAFDFHLSNIWALKSGSTGWSGPFDYSTKNYLQDRVNYIFIIDDGENIIGHNYRNMGNFLWGAATYILGIPEMLALSGAHWNNLINEPDFNFDSVDDQYSIKLGRFYAKTYNWKELAGKGNKNILK